MRFFHFDTKTLLFGLSLCFTALNGRVQASPLTFSQCVGQDSPVTPACSGTIDTLSEDPGTLVASLVSPLYFGMTGPDGSYVSSFAGNLVSAAYRVQPNTPGQLSPLTFYYQFQAAAGSPYTVDDFSVIPHGDYFIPSTVQINVGQRQSAAGLSVFADSTNTSLNSIAMSNVGGYTAGFTGSPLAPGGNSAILEVQTNLAYYIPTATIATDTVRDAQGNGTAAVGEGALLPALVPEPATWGLLGIGLLLAGSLRRRKR